MGRMGNNPLLSNTTYDLENSKDKESEIKKGRPKKDDIIRDNSVQKGLTADWTRATFILRVDLLDKLKDYAYTERLSLKEAIEQALEEFLKDKENLLPHR